MYIIYCIVFLGKIYFVVFSILLSKMLGRHSVFIKFCTKHALKTRKFLGLFLILGEAIT